MSSKTKKILKKAWNVTFTVIVVLVVACAIFLVGSRIAGFKVFNILSPSMEPKYSVGDLVYVKAIENGNIKGIEVGDDITFVVGEDLTVGTHRVIAIDEEKQQITTKGLANETEDPPVHFKNVIGEVKFAIPLMGYVSHFIQNPPGTYITLVLGAIFILLVFLPDIIGGVRKLAKKEEPVAVSANASAPVPTPSAQPEEAKKPEEDNPQE